MRCEAAETNYSANCQAQRLKTILCEVKFLCVKTLVVAENYCLIGAAVSLVRESVLFQLGSVCLPAAQESQLEA